MELHTCNARLERWDAAHIPGLLRHANGPRMARFMGENFPQPYTAADAEHWLAECRSLPEPRTRFAIVIDDAACGSIELSQGTREQRLSWHIGYWLGEAYWGRGIMTAATRTLVDYAFRELPCQRVYTYVFGDNRASARVLEKCLFHLEGRMKKHVFKDGCFHDILIYGRVEEG